MLGKAGETAVNNEASGVNIVNDADFESLIATYVALDVDDYRKTHDLAITLANLDFSEAPERRERVRRAFEDAFLSMKNFAAEGDTMGEHADAEYRKYATRQGARIGPFGFKYNDGERLTQEYQLLVHIYSKVMEPNKDELIKFLLAIISQWKQMYLRHHAFLEFSELTHDTKYARDIAAALFSEEEMDSRTDMLGWLAELDYTGNVDLATQIYDVANRLSENPCDGTAPLYIGNDEAISNVRDAANELRKLIKEAAGVSGSGRGLVSRIFGK
jgi:hypothetical protein